MLLMIAAIVTPNLIFVYSSMNMNLDENIGVTYISFGIH